MEFKKNFNTHKWMIVLTIGISIYFSYNFVVQEAKMQNISQSIYNKKIVLNKLDIEIKNLELDLKNVKSNKNIERLAREKLKMIAYDEVLYIIEEK